METKYIREFRSHPGAYANRKEVINPEGDKKYARTKKGPGDRPVGDYLL